MTTLWLDDIHPPTVSSYPLTDSVQWFKDSTGFLEALGVLATMKDNPVKIISFDNDLGEESLEGYECFNILEQYLYEGGFKNLKTIVVHSDNTSRVEMFLSASGIFKEKYGIEILRLRRNI